jgi:hypothetical protein
LILVVENPLTHASVFEFLLKDPLKTSHVLIVNLYLRNELGIRGKKISWRLTLKIFERPETPSKSTSEKI